VVVAQLVVITGEHQLGPGGLDIRAEAHQVDVIGHAHLVQDNQSLLA